MIKHLFILHTLINGLLCLCNTAGSQAIAQKPNIVLIVSDDHGLDALGCYGNPFIKTPSLDALAKDGIRFTNAFGTTASCSPSRSVILTGLHNHANGMYGLEHDESHFRSFDEIKSLPVILAEAGYLTARVGKFHVAPESVYQFANVLSPGKANDNASIGRNPVAMAELCQEMIQQKEKPFFLYFATDDPHRSMPHNTWPLPNRFGNRPEGYPGIKEQRYHPDSVIVPPFLPNLPMVRHELANYYQAVSRVDQGVGQLISILKQAGVYNNTLIIYLSDNGIAFQGAKTTVYDPGIHLPLIIKHPQGNNYSAVAHEMVSWTDIAPTILDFAGLSLKASAMHGKSLRNVLEGKANSLRDTIFASHTFHEIEMYYPMRAIRTRDFKLIWNIAHKLDYPLTLDLIHSSSWQAFVSSGMDKYGMKPVSQFLRRPTFELYDLKNDPYEVNNIADHPDYSAVKVALLKRLKQFQQETNDPWIRKWDFE